MRPRLSAALLVFLSTFAVYSLCLNAVWAIDHATSFLQLDWAMWNGHRFVLGSAATFQPGTVDDFAYGGNYYSALAPGTPVLALPFVGLGFALNGGYGVFHSPMLLSELFVALLNAVAASMVYLTGRFFFDKRVSAFLAFAYAFSTISWPFATYFFQSDVSAAFVLLAAYFALRLVKEGGSPVRDSILSGGAVAVALTVDYINAVFIPIVLFYVALSLRRKQRPLRAAAVGFVAASLLGVLAVMLYDLVNFGSPLSTTEQLYLHSSSVFAEFSSPVYLGVYLDLLSPYRGLLVFTPLLILGIFGLHDMLRSSEHRREGLFLLACFLGILLPYSMWYDPGGGEAFGQRFLVAAIPFLLLPAGMVLRTATRTVWAAAAGLYAVGVLMNGMAGVTSAVTPILPYNESPFLAWILPNFLRGGIDTWWVAYVGEYWWAPSAAIIAFAALLPLISGRLLLRRDRANPPPADA